MRWLGVALNLALRGAMLAMLAEALRRPRDPRFAGKGIGTRGLVIVPASLLVWAVRRVRPGSRQLPYPVWTDNLYLSLFVLDQAGNHFGWYDRYRHFDTLPHAHGTGAATVVLAELLELPAMSAIGLTQLLHIGLEAQEYYSDVLFGLHNVRGTWDTVSDLLAGAIGSAAYGALHAAARQRG
jgi:hypothetical protein